MRKRSTTNENLELSEIAERLKDIKEQMLDLLYDCRQLVRGTPEEERASYYWLAHIRCALDNEHSYLGGSMFTMQDCIDGLKEFDELHADE